VFRIYVIDSDEKTIELSFKDSNELYRFADVFIDHGYKVLIEKENQGDNILLNRFTTGDSLNDDRN
jgi:hypothetical protein